jgi:hypothetical protein
MEFIDSLGPVTLLIIGVILVAGWILLRIAFKLTATLFRIGCFLIFLIIAGGLALSLFA